MPALPRAIPEFPCAAQVGGSGEAVTVSSLRTPMSPWGRRGNGKTERQEGDQDDTARNRAVGTGCRADWDVCGGVLLWLDQPAAGGRAVERTQQNGWRGGH